MQAETQKMIILASASPRRKELLEKTNLSFKIDTCPVDETCQGNSEYRVKEIALRKAQAVAANYANEIVIAADTLVECEGHVLGKPSSPKEAEEMLKLLSGKWHQVYTGICIIDTKEHKKHFGVEKTDVLFAVLNQNLIEAYVSTKEPLDKAGAYGIQGLGEILIEEIRGSYSNVVGLPLSLLRKMLQALQIEVLPCRQ